MSAKLRLRHGGNRLVWNDGRPRWVYINTDGDEKSVECIDPATGKYETLGQIFAAAFPDADSQQFLLVVRGRP